MTGAGPAAASVWVVSDGRIGIERQALSLARATLADPQAAELGLAGPPRILRLDPSGWRTALRPDLWPAPLAALSPTARSELKPPWPRLWIAAGRRSIAYTLHVRRLAGEACFCVQVQDPRMSPARFDLVVPPQHDRVSGEPVFPILGPPTWFDAEDLNRTKEAFPASHERGDGPCLLVSVGGASRTHRLTPARTGDICALIARLAAGGARLWITTSRRTPDFARERLRQAAASVEALFWESVERDGPNPYLTWLTHCDAALVTEDSANLIADAAFFARPIHLLRLEGGSKRFDRLHEGFISRGAARWFVDRADAWTYPPVREASRAGAEILRRMAARGRPHPA